VINPNKDALESWAAANGIDGDFEGLCKNPKAKEYLLGELSKIGKEKKVSLIVLLFHSFLLLFVFCSWLHIITLLISQLKGFEFIKDIHLKPVPFDMDRDLITPTYKKKRPQLLKYYQVLLLTELRIVEFCYGVCGVP
jgi:long-chain acyl-CoA synthetase